MVKNNAKLNKMKKEAFTLMELVLVMVVIAVLAGGMIFGFTTYINKAHETGIITDFNAPLKNPVRMAAIEDGELPTAEELFDMYEDDGFTKNAAGVLATGVLKETVESGELTLANLSKGADATSKYFKIERGAKEYVVVTPVDAKLDDAGESIVIYAAHSSKNTAVRFTLNPAKNDITIVNGTIEGNGATPEVIEFVPES